MGESGLCDERERSGGEGRREERENGRVWSDKEMGV